jgi:hypothetical protein
MNTITYTGCGHVVAEGDTDLLMLNGGTTRKFTLKYDHRSTRYETTFI